MLTTIAITMAMTTRAATGINHRSGRRFEVAGVGGTGDGYGHAGSADAVAPDTLGAEAGEEFEPIAKPQITQKADETSFWWPSGHARAVTGDPPQRWESP